MHGDAKKGSEKRCEEEEGVEVEGVGEEVKGAGEAEQETEKWK